MFKVPTLQKLRFQLLAKKELGHCDYVGAASLKWTLSYVTLSTFLQKLALITICKKTCSGGDIAVR